MLIAVLSDIHDNIWKLEKALDQLGQAEVLLFCGDFCAPFTLEMMAEGFQGPLFAVLGNNDGDVLLLSRIAAKAGNVTLHSLMGKVTLGDREITLIHYPALASSLASGGKYDAVFYGHTHRPQVEERGETLLINPGEVMGRFGRPTYALYDTVKGEITLREL